MKEALGAWMSTHAVVAIVGVGLYALLEYLLPRTHAVRARSVIEGIINLLGAALKNVPWLGDVMLSLGSPQVPTLEQVMTATTVQDVTPTKPVKMPPGGALLLLAFLATCLLSCGVKPQVLVRDSIAGAAHMVKAAYAVSRDGAKSCAAKAAALPAKADAQKALDGCRASWAKDLAAVDVANDVLLDANVALPAIDAGAKAVNGKTVAEWVTALAAAASAAAKIADLPPVKGL